MERQTLETDRRDPVIYAILGALTVGAALGLFGSGGSILTVPVLRYLLGHEDKVAIAESLGVVGAIALVGAIPMARRRLVDGRTAVLFGVPGMAGTYLGAWVGGLVPGFVQLLVFGAVMLAASISMLRSPTHAAGSTAPRPRSRLRWIAEGLAVGVLTGFVGVGGGFLVVPALVVLGNLELRVAVGTSLVIIAMNAATGSWKHLHLLAARGSSVDVTSMAIIIGFGIAGSFIGQRLGGRFSPLALRRTFGAFLLVMAVFVIARESLEIARPSLARTPPSPSVDTGG